MKRIVAFPLFGFLLLGIATAEVAATTLPWTTMSDLRDNAVGGFVLGGCGDARPMALYVVADGVDTYHVLVNEDIRWAIIGPVDAGGKARIWYGTILREGRLVIERDLVGTPDTDVCPFLIRASA